MPRKPLSSGSSLVEFAFGSLILWMVGMTTMAATPTTDVLPGTRPLTMQGDIAADLVAGADRFLLRELEQSIERRGRHWQRDVSSVTAYNKSVLPNRTRLVASLGACDRRAEDPEPRFVSRVSATSRVGQGEGYEVHAVTWAAFGDVLGRGLMLSPSGRPPTATVIAIPDCNCLPEQLVGLVPGVDPQSQYARRLAENGCRVIVPLLINRDDHLPKLSHREWLYRSAFEMGRGLIAYEVETVLAIVDWASASEAEEDAKIGVIGWAEGGLIGFDLFGGLQ